MLVELDHMLKGDGGRMHHTLCQSQKLENERPRGSAGAAPPSPAALASAGERGAAVWKSVPPPQPPPSRPRCTCAPTTLLRAYKACQSLSLSLEPLVQLVVAEF